MQINIAGRHMAITDAVRDYADEKIGRVAKIHDRDDMIIDVILHVEKNPANKNRDVAEVTARMKGIVVRAEEAAPDMYAAIDLVSEKLERQMRKYKERLVDRRTSPTVLKTAPGDNALGHAEEDEAKIVRTKVVDAKPMTEDEAMMQLDLLGHDFFVYRSADTDDINVLYRRADGNYGLIQPTA